MAPIRPSTIGHTPLAVARHGRSMDRVFFILGAVLAGMGVAAGAFGAHGLRGRLTPELLVVFETGVRFHLIHALGLLAVAWATTRWPGAPPEIGSGPCRGPYRPVRRTLTIRA